MTVSINAELLAEATRLGIDVRDVVEAAVELERRRAAPSPAASVPTNIRHGSLGEVIRVLRDDERF